MIHVYDGLNVIRRALETDPMGRAPRSLFLRTATTPGIHVWCFEGQGSLVERRKILPSYKHRPKTMTDGFHEIAGMIRDVLGHTNAIQVQVPGYEADDAIATVAFHYSGKAPITIHTTDKDLTALAAFPGVAVTAKPIPNCEPGFVHLYKTYVGDKSDRIPGIRGFGDKTWELANKEELWAATVALLNGVREPDHFLQANLPEKIANKIVEQADHVAACWAVSELKLIPTDTFVKHMKPGTMNAVAADEILRRYRQ